MTPDRPRDLNRGEQRLAAEIALALRAHAPLADDVAERGLLMLQMLARKP